MYKFFKIFSFFVLFFSFTGYGQNICFQKVYTFNDTLGIISCVKQVDSMYVLGASTGRFNRTSASVIFLDQYGNVIENHIYKDSNRAESLGFGSSKAKKDNLGRFMFFYTARDELNWKTYPKIMRYDEFNQSLSTIELDTFVKSYFQCRDKSQAIVDIANDRYYFIENYNYLNQLDTSSSLPMDVGAFVMCFQLSNDSLIYIKRHNYNTIASSKPRRAMVNYLPYSNDVHLLIMAQDFVSQGTFNTLYSKTLFFKLNPTDGSVIAQYTLHDTPWSEPGYGAVLINNDKDLLISYTESDTLYTSTTIPQPYYAVRPTVARLDSNFQVVWKDTLRSYWSSTLGCGGCIEKFVVNELDSSFVAAFPFLSVTNEGTLIQENYDVLRLTKRNYLNGEIIWNRDYTYYTTDLFNDPLYSISDAELTNDSGYIFVGTVENFDSLQANAPGQLGYILKTNCLGFLDDPQAGFSTTNNDSLGVQFTNISLMGSSYLWDFGDGTTLQTGEFDSAHPPVYHQYADSGSYDVMLIAYGCNGANDTVSQTVVVSKSAPVDTVNPNITNYMALGPNPVKSGESIAVYVGNLPNEKGILSFYDEQGKVVLERALPQSNTTYILILPFGAGMYQAVLHADGKRLEVEKVVVY